MRKWLFSSQILETKYLCLGRVEEWSCTQESPYFRKVACNWKERLGKCCSELMIVTIGLLWQVLPQRRSLISLPRISIFEYYSYKRSRSWSDASHLFTKLIFLSLLLVPLFNVATTSMVHRQVNPLANKLCPGFRAMWDVSVQSCLQSNMT